MAVAWSRLVEFPTKLLVWEAAAPPEADICTSVPAVLGVAPNWSMVAACWSYFVDNVGWKVRAGSLFPTGPEPSLGGIVVEFGSVIGRVGRGRA